MTHTSRAALVAGAFGLMISAAEAKTLVYCSEGSPENFNPALNTTGTSLDVALPVYNRLVQFKRGSTEIGPALAEKWDISADGLTYTFHLRKGVKVHSSEIFKPKRDLNADDVLYSFNRQWNKDHPFYKVSGGSYDYFNDMDMPAILKSLDKLDDHTVRFTLNRPEAPFLADLAMPFASIQSAEYADAMMKAGTPERVDQEPIGSGPFQFVRYQKDAVIRYKAFDQYWGGKRKVDQLVFSITPDASVRLAKVKANECQITGYLNPADLEGLAKEKDLTVLSQPGLNIGYIAMNNLKKPFDDKRVRLAVQHAINKQAIIKAVYREAGQPAVNPIPPIMWGYNKAIKDYGYDPEKSKQLLKEAGLADGFETDLWAIPVSRPYNPDGKRVAELVQADLAKVGIKAKIVTYEWGEYRKRLDAGEHMLGMYGWTGDNGDPDNFLYTLFGCSGGKPNGNNAAKWCDQKFLDLVTKAKTITDMKERAKLYEDAQVVVHDESPWYEIAHSIVYKVTRKNVTGYKISPFDNNEFDDVELQ